MQSNTISVSPVPLGTTTEKIRQIFQAFSVKNVHIDFPTAYVEFDDEGDLENLDIQFDNYEVANLNNAKIDKSEFNWSSVNKENTSPDKKSDSSSDKHQDLMAADIDHLIVVQHCDELFLKNLSEENIRALFKDFHSLNRIVKRRTDVILEFTHAGEIEQLQAKFPNLSVPELGWDSVIEKADPTKITAQDFVSEWSKDHTKESVVSEATTHLGYEEEKPSSGDLPRQKKFELGSFDQKPSSQKVLHQDIIPPFDKKTSMEVNFLNEQSKLGYKEEKHEEPIHEASTHQELDYTTEIKIEPDENEERFGELGYEAAEKEKEAQLQREREEKERLEKERKQAEERQQERLRKEEEEKHRREEQERQRQQEEQRKRLEEEQREKQRKEEQERLRKQEEERQRLLREEQEVQRKREEQERRRQEQEKRKQEQEKRRQQQEKRRQEQQRARLAAQQQQERKRRQEQRLDKELKEKLEIQRQKFEKEEQERKRKQQEQHHIPTESQNVAREAEFIKEAGKTIEQQLGYAVNKAKEQSTNLVNAGLEILRGHEEKKPEDKFGYDSSIKEEPFDVKKEESKLGYDTQAKEEPFDVKKEESNLGYDKPEIKEEVKKVEELGYEKQPPKEAGLDLLNSSFQFLKGSYNKIQQQIGSAVAKAKQASHPSELGYEKWTVKPDFEVPKPVAGQQPRVLKTLVTITLLIWVVFLLIQDTSSASESVVPEVEIGLPTVDAVETTQEEAVTETPNA